MGNLNELFFYFKLARHRCCHLYKFLPVFLREYRGREIKQICQHITVQTYTIIFITICFCNFAKNEWTILDSIYSLDGTLTSTLTGLKDEISRKIEFCTTKIENCTTKISENVSKTNFCIETSFFESKILMCWKKNENFCKCFILDGWKSKNSTFPFSIALFSIF